MRTPPALAGAGWASLAGALWGTNGGLGGFLMAGGLSPLVVSAFRCVLAAALVLGWMALVERRRLRLPRAALGWSALGGLALCANFGLYFIAIEATGVSVAVILKACAPLLVVLLAAAGGIERLSPGRLAACALVVAGVALVASGRPGAGLTVDPLGAAAAIGAALGYAGFTFAFRAAQRDASPTAVVAVAFVFAAAALYLWAGEWPAWPVGWSLAELAAVGHMALVGTVLAFLAYNRGLRLTEAGIAAVAATVEPLVASAIGWWWLGERLDAVQITGAVLILATVATVAGQRRTAP
jgi:drug/metabolite transporter (DMT)-like permease